MRKAATNRKRRPCRSVILASLEAVRSHDGPETGYRLGWRQAHCRAWNEHPIARAVDALAALADEHLSVHGSPIGEDGVLSECWLEMAHGLVGLLNGDLGGLDGGTVDGLIRDLARAAKFTEREADELIAD